MSIADKASEKSFKYPIYLGSLTVMGGLSYLIYNNYFKEK